MDSTIKVGHLKSPVYVKQNPYIDDEGLFMPCEEYVLEGHETYYRMVISKEQFVEMYKKWIKGE